MFNTNELFVPKFSQRQDKFKSKYIYKKEYELHCNQDKTQIDEIL